MVPTSTCQPSHLAAAPCQAIRQGVRADQASRTRALVVRFSPTMWRRLLPGLRRLPLYLLLLLRMPLLHLLGLLLVTLFHLLLLRVVRLFLRSLLMVLLLFLLQFLVVLLLLLIHLLLLLLIFLVGLRVSAVRRRLRLLVLWHFIRMHIVSVVSAIGSVF